MTLWVLPAVGTNSLSGILPNEVQLFSLDFRFGTAKRQDTLFNKEELRPKRSREITGLAARVCHWAAVHKAKSDPETLKLFEWLMAQIEETCERREAQRAS